MSFIEQERALFDLLFDTKLRERFCVKKSQALFDYKLNDQEKSELNKIRTSSLMLDANMRRSMILSYIGKHYPLSFALNSSLPYGIEHFKSIITPQLVRLPQTERLIEFGTKLKKSLSLYRFDNELSKNIFVNILDCEISMASTRHACHQHHTTRGNLEEEHHHTVSDDWLIRPILLSPFLSAHLLPQNYDSLVNILCPNGKSTLWRVLQKNPLDVSVINSIIENQEHSLLIAKAVVESPSRCDPEIIHKTLTLSPGFGDLLKGLNGEISVKYILDSMRKVGADDELLNSIESGFFELIKNQMCYVLS